jgi:hypothetical protein
VLVVAGTYVGPRVLVVAGMYVGAGVPVVARVIAVAGMHVVLVRPVRLVMHLAQLVVGFGGVAGG